MTDTIPEASDSHVACLEHEVSVLRSAVEKMWPVVTRHTQVSFWGPIENELRKARRQTSQASNKEEE